MTADGERRVRDVFRLWHFIIIVIMNWHDITVHSPLIFLSSSFASRTIRKSNKQRSKKLINSILFVYVRVCWNSVFRELFIGHMVVARSIDDCVCVLME